MVAGPPHPNSCPVHGQPGGRSRQSVLEHVEPSLPRRPGSGRSPGRLDPPAESGSVAQATQGRHDRAQWPLGGRLGRVCVGVQLLARRSPPRAGSPNPTVGQWSGWGPTHPRPNRLDPTPSHGSCQAQRHSGPEPGPSPAALHRNQPGRLNSNRNPHPAHWGAAQVPESAPDTNSPGSHPEPHPTPTLQ